MCVCVCVCVCVCLCVCVCVCDCMCVRVYVCVCVRVWVMGGSGVYVTHVACASGATDVQKGQGCPGEGGAAVSKLEICFIFAHALLLGPPLIISYDAHQLSHFFTVF